jgi:hypothetical protein
VDEDGDELTSCYVVPEAAVKQTVAARRENEAMALELIENGVCRADPQSEFWVGLCIAEAFSLDMGEPKQKAAAKGIIKRLISENKIKEVIRNDEKRKPRKFVEVVKKDNLSTEEAAPPSAPPCEKPCEDHVGGLFD